MNCCKRTVFRLLLILVVTTAVFFWTVCVPNAAEPLEKASISFRIAVSIWSDDARFNQLMEFFDKYPGATDEVTFFTQGTHTPIPDEELERRCEILKRRCAQVREHGLRAGINVLCTFGHHPEDLPHGIGPEYPRALTIDGVVAQGTLCPNNEIFLKRIERIYTAAAKAEPDYIWIDDDVRTYHMVDSSGAAGPVCFCDECMAFLSQRFGQEITREELRNRMGDHGTLVVVRQATSDIYNRMFALIEETVHKIDPKIALGFMTGERYDESYDFARWARTLAGPDGDKEVYWRPGGGFYEQSNMGALFGKSHELGRQIATLPPEIAVIQSEIENFPYQPLSKSAVVTTLEAASHIAAGCTGAAFNVMTFNEEPLDEYERMIATIAERRPFYDRAVRALGRAPNVGVLPLWDRNEGSYGDRSPVQWLTSGMAEIGLPIAYDFTQDADVVLLSRAYLNHHSRDEMIELFKKGVYTDNDTIGLANDPPTYALNDLTGMEYGGVISVDGIEKFESHPLNGRFAGRTRDLRQSFWREPIYALHFTSPDAQVLSSCVDYGNEKLADAILGIYENPLGGRVCLNGFYPWSNFYNYPKQAQIRAIMRWLSKDRLPGYVESFAKMYLWIRAADEQSDFAAIAINANYDDEKDVAIMFKTEKNAVTVVDYSGEEISVSADATDDAGYRRFIIPRIKAWEPVLITTKTPSLWR